MEFTGTKVEEGPEGGGSRSWPLLLAIAVQTAILLAAITTLRPASAPPPPSPEADPSPSPAGPSARDVADLQEHLLLVQRELKEVRAEQKASAREQLAQLEALSQAPQLGPRTKRPAPRPVREAGEVATGAGPAPQILVPRALQSVGGGRYQNRVDGSILVWIPGGKKAAPDGTQAKLEKGVFLGISEVSWGQYLLFCQATGWKVPSPTIDARARGGRVYRATANDPVFNVSFADAKAYLEWAGLRLPSEREWRFAALECEPVTRTSANVNVADLSRDWRWGAGSKDFKEEDAGQGNDAFPYLAPVQFFHQGRSQSGCYGLLGNLSEWVGEPAPEAEAGGEGRGPLVFCGASWYLPPNRARWDYRFRVAKTFKGNALGFRVALSSR